MGAGHPECPQRLDAISRPPARHRAGRRARAAATRRWSTLERRSRRAHSSGYVAELERPARAGGRQRRVARLDPDTIACPGTWRAALRAAGAAVAATDAVLDGEVEQRLLRGAPARPPRDARRRRWASASSTTWPSRRAMRSTCAACERVAIVDFDVHHGNGTEDIIAGDERVLMVELLPAPAVPVQRRACRMGTNMSTCRCRPTRAAPEVRDLIEAILDAAARGVRAADDLHLGRLRRPPRRRPRPARPGRGRLRVDHAAHQGTWPTAMRRAASCRASRAATTSARWHAASRRTCACWPTVAQRSTVAHRVHAADELPRRRDRSVQIRATLTRRARWPNWRSWPACCWPGSSCGCCAAATRPVGSVWFGSRIFDGVLFPLLALLFALRRARALAR